MSLSRKTPLRRKTRLKPVSLTRASKAEERKAVRQIVITRDKICQARRDPDHVCEFYPDRRVLECDEIAGGSWREIEWLDPSRIQLLCPAGHTRKHADRAWAIEWGLWSPHPDQVNGR